MVNRRHKILVVDDERAIVSTLSAIFESLGYETATASSGEEEIQVASSFQPECIVSDVKMGRINGIEAAMEVLSRLPQCRVLLMSGDAPCLDLLSNALAKGQNFEVLQKPVPMSELLTRVSQLLSDSADPGGDCAYRHYRQPVHSKNPSSGSFEGECGKEFLSDGKMVAVRKGAA